jgi:ABC-type branched-subunit amino acid transport system substrate-binding protein
MTSSGIARRALRWRAHIAAAIALLLVLGIAAVGGTDARALAKAKAEESAKRQADLGNGRTSSGLDLSQLTGVEGSTADGLGDTVADDAGNTSATSGTGTGPAGATPGATRRVTYDDGANDQAVLVGGSTFTSGPAAVYGEQIAVGFAAGVNYVNGHGGINGRRLKVKIYDDGADPAKQLANTKRLVEVDHVFALTMSYAAAVGPYVAEKGIPVYHLGQFAEEFTNPWWFPVGAPQGVAAMALADYGANTLKVKTVSIFYLDAGSNNYSRAYADTVARYWRAYGVDVKTINSFAPDQTSCSDAVSAARGANVDFIDFELDAGHVIQCGVEAQIQGYKPPKKWGGYLIGVPVIHEALGDYSIGMVAFDAFGANYAVKDYVDEVKKVSSKTDTYSSVTMSYFISAKLAQDSMSQLGDNFTRVHLRDVLNTFTDWTPRLTNDPNQPTFTWRPNCHIGLSGFYEIEIRKQPDGSLRWDQIVPIQRTVPLPPGVDAPPEFAACSTLVRR